MSSDHPSLYEIRGEYGIDGGVSSILAGIGFGAIGLGLLGLGAFHACARKRLLAGVETLGGLLFLQMVPSYLYSTRKGKFVVWGQLLDDLSLRGDESILDVGCGRGAVLGLVAKRLPRGRAVGLDLWRTRDQTGNAMEATWRNLDAEGVRSRCELHTADMRSMPFPDATFDAVVSSLAIHNIDGAEGRTQTLAEVVRVLKPGGRLLIADLMFTATYARELSALGMEEVVKRPLGWRFFYGALGMMTGLVTAKKPTLG
jgi:ubiquinone/menaquinone biosynthesis C-methylase UbiE